MNTIPLKRVVKIRKTEVDSENDRGEKHMNGRRWNRTI